MAAASETEPGCPQLSTLWDDELWHDVEPIEQNDGACPIVPIAYSDNCEVKRETTPERTPPSTNRCFSDTRALGLFRAICAKQELSERALDLTFLVAKQNMGHYTAWWVNGSA